MRLPLLSWNYFAVFLNLLLGVTTSVIEARANDWPQWRGPTRDGHAAGETWPKSLKDNHLSLAWRVDLGPSYSGPVVFGDRVFTTETRGKKTEVVSAYDRFTGERLWTNEWLGSMSVPFFAASNGSWIRATPACDGKLLFVAGMCDMLKAIEIATGDTKWSIDFKSEFGTPLPKFGFASSPIVHGDAVFVQAGGGFVKLDRQTGSVVWRTATDGGGMMGSAFSSPFFTNTNGRPLALVQTRRELKGIDPKTGGEAWSQKIEAFRGMNILTPTVHNGAVFTSAHTGRSQLWQIPEAQSDSGNPSGLKQLWANKSQAYMSSPVVVGDYLYMHLRNQRIQCVDLNTGKETWRTKPYGKYQSMAVQDNRILALDQRGQLLLFHADPTKFDLIDTRKVSDDETWAHIAVCGGQIFIRELEGLTVYEWQ